MQSDDYVPSSPGRYFLRTIRPVKVVERNGQLMAIVGRWVRVAVPVAAYAGQWVEPKREKRSI